MRRIKSHFQKMKFLNKVRLIYSLLIFIPILGLECFVLSSSGNFIREQQMLEVEETIGRNFLNIQNQMDQCEKSILYLVSNSMLKEFLNTNDNEYLKRVQMAKNIAPLLYNSLLSSQYFSKIQVYSDKKFAVSNDLFKEKKEVSETVWYEKTLETLETLWWHDEDGYFITKRVINDFPEKVLAAIKINIKDDIFQESFSMFSKMPVRISIKDKKSGVEIYSYTNDAGKEIKQLGYEEIKEVKNAGWIITYGIGEDNFSTAFHPRIMISIVIVILILILAWAAVNYSTKYLLKYLFRLLEDVKSVKDDNFEIRVDESSQDEIGELAQSINRMLQKIQLLIDEIYKSELSKKNLELNLLQSKINPHFLYNNLSAINWIAIENGEDQIYEITTQMASFYRTALNKGVNIDKVRVEAENIKAYIKLQIMAHDDSFTVDYDIPAQLLEADIPIFIMQPLVENAIEHGIDTLRDMKGHISIKVSEDNGVILIEIRDNGQELFHRIGNTVMDTKYFGYGVSNVNQRIQLMCGEAYGVRISADENGTLSSVRIKEDSIVLQSHTSAEILKS